MIKAGLTLVLYGKGFGYYSISGVQLQIILKELTPFGKIDMGRMNTV
jgi:hypothetical protein